VNYYLKYRVSQKNAYMTFSISWKISSCIVHERRYFLIYYTLGGNMW